MSDYFNHKAISNSSLSLIDPEVGGNPEMYIKGWVENKPSPSQELGTQIHQYALEPHLFEYEELEVPTGLMYEFCHELKRISRDPNYPDLVSMKEAYEHVGFKRKSLEKIITEFKDYHQPYYESIFKLDSHSLSKDRIDLLERCSISLKSNVEANELLSVEGECELEVYWNEDLPTDQGIVPVACKGKLDKLIINGSKGTIVDLKTTSKSSYKFKESFEMWKYYRQMAFYRSGVQKLYGLEEVEVKIIVIETTGNHKTLVYTVGESYLQKGCEEYKKLLKRIWYHSFNNQWERSMEEVKGLVLEYEGV